MRESGNFAFFLRVQAMKKILIATAVAIAMSGAASAADMSMPMKARAAPPLAGGGGYGLWNQSHFNFDTATGAVNSLEQTAGGRGYYGEVGGGCDYQFSLGNLGNFVVGVLGGYDFMSLKGAYTDTFLGGFSGYEKEQGSGFVGGRIGYLITPNLLTYVSGGWTDARFSAISMNFVGGGPLFIVPSHTYTGYFIGGGAETSLSPWLPQGFFLRTDYRVSTYSAANLGYIFAPTGAPFGESTHMNKYVQQIGTELIYRFSYH
jgi:outer membrane immunogenic protein